MDVMRIALAQIHPVVGDVEGNETRARAAVEEAAEQGARLVLLPELVALGYPPRDLLLRPRVIRRCLDAVERLARLGRGGGPALVIGSPRPAPDRLGRELANAAACCRDGEVVAWYEKRLLPNYDVFEEDRYFEPGDRVVTFEHEGARLGITICEDLWNDAALLGRRLYETDLVAELVAADVHAILNISASPWWVGKPAFRRRLFGAAARRAGVPLAFVNQVGGNDELVFDGHSALFDAEGSIRAEGPAFAEGLLVADLPLPAGPEGGPDEPTRDRPPVVRSRAPLGLDLPNPEIAELFHALVLGIRDYVRKCGFRQVHLGLSGGIDSAVVAALARAALGPDAVSGIGMPSRFSSDGSISDARILAERLGIGFDVIPIEPAHHAMLDMLEPHFRAVGTPPGVAEENIQSRLRGNILMALTNKTGSLLLTTGNKSELAVGYCTLYGDMAGGLAVLCDVPKTAVYRLARWINRHPAAVFGASGGPPPIPDSTLDKPPSAELRPDQTDLDSLPPYEVLDPIIERYVERHESVADIVAATGSDETLVRRVCGLIDRNEYKRRQLPVGIKATSRAFGIGWRMPIAARGVSAE